jgi:ribosomal protein L28
LITSISPFVVAATVASIIHALNARKRFWLPAVLKLNFSVGETGAKCRSNLESW